LDALPVATPAHQLHAASASARLVIAIAPELEARVATLVEDLGRSMPRTAELVASHGDFNARQLMIEDGDLALTDFDEFCLAPPALDLATFMAYVVRAEPGVSPEADRVLAALLDGYCRRPRDMSWYLATMILRRAPRPFRYFEPDWPSRVETMVHIAEEARGW
jgi:aminoglycoside phosphotransferase (APT) family kinase protein